MNGTVCCLVRVRTPQGTTSFLMNKPEFTIGRSQESDIPFADPSMSRLHLKIVMSSEGPMAIDLGSANGTRLGQTPLQAQRPFLLKPQDGLQLGLSDQFLFFEIVQAPIELQPSEEQRQSIKGLTAQVQKDLEESNAKVLEQQKAKLIDGWNLEYEELRRQAKSEAENIRLKAEQEREVKLKKSESEAAQLISEANLAAQEIRRAEEKKKLEIETETLKTLAEKKARAETEAEEIRTRATREAQEIRQSALSKADESAQKALEEARQEAEKMRTNAQTQSEQRLSESRAQAEQLVSKAREEAQALMQNAEIESKKSAEFLLQQHRSRMDLENEKFQREMKTFREDELQKIKLQAEETQHAVIQKFQDQIRTLKAETEKAQQARTQLQETLQARSAELDQVSQKLESSRSAQIELSAVLEGLKKEKEEALKLIQKKETAVQEMEEAKARKKKLDNESLKLEDHLKQRQGEIANELKAVRDQLVVENENLKKKMSEDAARMQIKAFEDLKVRIDAEEKKLKEIRKAQSAEVARTLELKFVGLKKDIPADLVRQTVAEVLGQTETQLKIETQHLVETPEEGQKKRSRKFYRTAAASVAVLLLAGLWQKDALMRFLREGGLSAYAEELIQQRRKASVYNPKKDNRFRDNYTDNVLFFADYYEIKTDPEYTNQWTIQLNDLELVRSLGSNEEDMVQFLTKEFNLVKRLGELKMNIDAHYLDEGLHKLREAEAETKAEMLTLLKSQKNLDRIRKLEKASIEKFAAQRALQLRTRASEEPPGEE